MVSVPDRPRWVSVFALGGQAWEAGREIGFSILVESLNQLAARRRRLFAVTGNPKRLPPPRDPPPG